MMDIPLATTGTSRSHSLHSLPGIQIDGPKDFRRSRVPFRPSTFNPITAAALSGSEPMAIPNAKDDVPPPLPPPRHIPDPDLALRYVKGRHDEPKTLPPIQPGSSLLAGLPLSSSSSRSSAPRRPSADGSRSPEPSKPSRNVSPSMDFVEASPRRDALKHMDEGYDSLPGSMPISHTGYVHDRRRRRLPLSRPVGEDFFFRSVSFEVDPERCTPLRTEILRPAFFLAWSGVDPKPPMFSFTRSLWEALIVSVGHV